jgi:hypothetical protein
LLLFFVVSAPAFAACSAAHDGSTESAATAMPTMHGAAPAAAAATPANLLATADQPLPNADAMWAARPDYVRANPETEAAYHYAILHPQLVKWMPCYCGCSEMGHGSNLDCYLRPGAATFEEHASYCDICVQITLKTRDLVNQGKSLNQIRAIVDQTWGGSIPGTPTALPPV